MVRGERENQEFHSSMHHKKKFTKLFSFSTQKKKNLTHVPNVRTGSQVSNMEQSEKVSYKAVQIRYPLEKLHLRLL